MSLVQRVRAAAVILVAMVSLGWLSRAPWDQPAAAHGLLRLSWRMHGERVETCRARTPAELDKLPVHMRTDEVCAARLVAYRLVLQVDDAAPDTIRVLPGGARGDRPLFVLRDTPLAAGRHRVRVRFEREGPARDAAPPLVLDTNLVASAGRIDLVTLDPHTPQFILRTSRE